MVIVPFLIRFRHKRGTLGVGRLAWRGKLVSASLELTSPLQSQPHAGGPANSQLGTPTADGGGARGPREGRNGNRSLCGILAVTVIASRGSTHQYSGPRLPALRLPSNRIISS